MHPTVQTLIDAWNWSYIDMADALDEIAPEHLHLRPSPDLICISEQIAHLMRSESSIIGRYIFNEPESVWAANFLTQPPYGWPPDILLAPVDPRLKSLSQADLKQHLDANHQRLLEKAQTLDLPPGHPFQDDWSGPAPTLEVRLRFAAYHVAYHVGQIYQTRHLLGEITPDN